MNNEFTKIKSGSYVRYVLEDGGSGGASSGGTSSGSIASMDTPIGKDQIVVQSRMGPKEPPKPRNFVAKNAKMGGAGKMKDKSKTLPRHEKHKKPVAEEWSQKYKSSINCSHPKGFSQKAHCAGKKKHEESMMTMEAVCPDCGMCQTHGNISEIKKGAKDSNGFTKCWPGKHAVGTKTGKNGGQVRNCVPNEGLREAMDMPPSYDQMSQAVGTNPAIVRQADDSEFAGPKMMRRMVQLDKQERELMGNPEFEQERSQMKLKRVRGLGPAADRFNWDNYYAPLEKLIQKYDTQAKESVAESNPEYDDEAGMAHSNLLTSARAVLGLLKTIKDRDNLPEWGQEKIAKAEMMLVSVWDYLQSQKEQGIDPQVAEGYGRNRGYQHGFASPTAPRLGSRPNHGDDERHDLDDPELQRNRQEVTSYNITIDGKPINPKPIFGRSATIAWGKQQAAAGVDLSNAMISPVREGVAEGDSVAKYKIKQIGSEGGKDYYISPNTGKKVYKTAQVGDHETPNGEHKPKLRMPYKEGDYNDYLAGMLENLLAERSKSKAQWDLMHAVAHNPQFANQVKIKPSVGQEFSAADSGHERSALPDRVLKTKSKKK